MTKRHVFQAVAAAALLTVGGYAQACSLGAWFGSDGDAVAGGPEEGGLARYSGECSMSASDGYVQENTPADEPRMIVRFYFLPSGTGSAVIFRALADQPGSAADAPGDSIYDVVYNGAAETLTIDATSAGGGTIGPVDVSDSDGWTSVEIDWEAGQQMLAWINTDAKTNPGAALSANAGNGTINAARLGPQGPAAKGSGLTVVFDDYEARRTTAVGRLLRCDALQDGTINVGDLQAYVNEILERSLITGVAACLEDGAVNVGDIQETVNIILER